MAAAAGSLLKWDVAPQNGHGVYFSREIYEKYSLAPSLSELLLLSKRPVARSAGAPNSGQENKALSAQASGPAAHGAAKPSTEAAPFQEPRVPYPYVSSLTERAQRKYLFLLSTYVKADPSRIDLSQQKDYSQYLRMKEFVSKEVAEFLKFAQNAARSCAKDYEVLSEEAALYIETFSRARVGSVRKYPECYSLHEVASILGGRFSPELTLKFEKCLVALGKVPLVRRFFPNLPAPIQLPDPLSRNELDVAASEQRASALHNDISTDQNAKKLAAKYCPQVVLTSESLFVLLNNHGRDYREEWELPVSVIMVSEPGLKSVKVAYIDPPVPKKEMTVREKNQVFHEFLIDFHMTKHSSVFAHAVIMDKFSEEHVGTPLEMLQGRQRQESDAVDLDFDIDFTELETFGSVTKTPHPSHFEKAAGKSRVFLECLQEGKETVGGTKSGGREGMSKASSEEKEKFLSEPHFNTNLPPRGDAGDQNVPFKSPKAVTAEADGDEGDKEKNVDHKALLGSSERAEDFQERTEAAPEDPSEVLSCRSDTDEEALVIDTEGHGARPLESSPVGSGLGPGAGTPQSPYSEEGPAEKGGDCWERQKLDGPQKTPGGQSMASPQKSSRQLSEQCDPLGQILKMQAELLQATSPCHPGQPEGIPERRTSNPPLSQEGSSPKAMLPSSLRPAENTTAEARLSWVSYFQGSQKGVFWDGSEDRSEYDPPLQGNLVYKLFSLEDLLLLVRCPVQKAELHPRNKKAKVRRLLVLAPHRCSPARLERWLLDDLSAGICCIFCCCQASKLHFPVYVLPKVEYQAFYGAEALTESELCRLWTESLLHSNSSFEVGHIDALTSKLFLLEPLSAEDLRRKLGTFKPANSLNILQHILKKVVGLPEGAYLLAHAAGDASVTIYKSSDGTSARPIYNLHAAHSDLPSAPSAIGVPWVPLDPSLPLPHHFAHGRVPCTFPPKPANPQKKQKMSGTKVCSGTPNRKEQVAVETTGKRQPAHPLQKRPGAAQSKAAAKQISRQASRGPNWNFWKQNRDEP